MDLLDCHNRLAMLHNVLLIVLKLGLVLLGVLGVSLNLLQPGLQICNPLLHVLLAVGIFLALVHYSLLEELLFLLQSLLVDKARPSMIELLLRLPQLVCNLYL